MQWRPGQWLLTLLIALMVIPPIVLMIPLFQMVVDMNELNTYQSVIVIYTGIMLPFSTFLLVSFFSTIPGPCSRRRAWTGPSVEDVHPGRPAAVRTGAGHGDRRAGAVGLERGPDRGGVPPENSLRTLMVGLTLFKSRYQVDVPIVMAGMLVATVPMFLLYLVGQRFFIRGHHCRRGEGMKHTWPPTSSTSARSRLAKDELPLGRGAVLRVPAVVIAIAAARRRIVGVPRAARAAAGLGSSYDIAKAGKVDDHPVVARQPGDSWDPDLDEAKRSRASRRIIPMSR